MVYNSPHAKDRIFSSMASLKHYLNSVIGEAMADATQSKSCNANVITSSKPGFGDYQANGSMSEAKRRGMKPRDLAEQVIISLKQSLPSLIDRLEIGGPGFINIHLSDSEIKHRATRARHPTDTRQGLCISLRKIGPRIFHR